MYFFNFIYYISRIVFSALTNLKSTEQWGKTFLHELEEKFGGNFDNAVIEKVAKYQSIQLHYVANAFSKLNGRLNNEIEKERNILFFLMSVLYDEIIDEQKMNEESLDHLFNHPENVNPTNFNEKILVYIHQRLLNEVDDKESYWKSLQNTHQAQKDSKKQFNSQTTIDEILDITQRKGGHTLLMCRHYINEPSNSQIDECWYTLGGLIQMTNDLFDTYKDTISGIDTFATKIKNIESINSIYQEQAAQLYANIKVLPFTKRKKIAFAINMSIIPAFGQIAINQLKQLSLNSNTLPNFKDVNRKDLIIDMEKNINIIRLIGYAYKYGKSWM
jgi:hypothetical protein